MVAPTRVGADTISNSSVNRNPISFTHTTTSDTDILIVCILVEGGEFVDTPTPTFNSVDMTEIADTGSQSNSDVRLYAYGLVSPGAVTNGTVNFDFGSNLNPSAAVALNYTDSDTASVAAATNNISQDVNTSNTSTAVMASGGSSGNTLLAFACGQGSDMEPISWSGSFAEIWDEETGADTNADFGHAGAELTSGPPSGVTATFSTSDQNTGLMIEIVAAGGAAAADRIPLLTLQGAG